MVATSFTLASFRFLVEHVKMELGRVRLWQGRLPHLPKHLQLPLQNDNILGFAYRCWASLQARHLLNWPDTWAHPDIHGNRRHHQSAHLWSSITQQIEEAFSSKQVLGGLTADVEKAYNCLPRWFVQRPMQEHRQKFS